jgi:methionyl-tRNA formyltransferase
MKIAFFGTPDFTVDFLDKLNETGFVPSLIVTNPDRPSGRGMNFKSPLPKIWSDAHDIHVLQPEKIDQDFIDNLGDWDLFVVIAYGKILPESLINLPKYGTINIHYSLLPKYRGATPVESAILHGDQVTGVVIQQMRYKLDSGPLLAQREVTITPDDTTPSLREKLNEQALNLLPEVLKRIETGSLKPIEQIESNATHCKKISKEDGLLNLSDNGITNDKKYRAYYGSIGTYFFADNKRFKITKAHLEDEQFVIDEVIPENGKKLPYNKI